MTLEAAASSKSSTTKTKVKRVHHKPRKTTKKLYKKKKVSVSNLDVVSSLPKKTPVSSKKTTVKKVTKADKIVTGPWSILEKRQFVTGVRQYGWGNWSLIQQMVPTRTAQQIGCHARRFDKVSLFLSTIIFCFSR